MLYAIKLPQKDGKDLYLRKFFSGELESTQNLQMAMYWPERQMAETVCAELEGATIVEGSETIYTIMRWHTETFPDATLWGQLDKYQEEQNEWIDSNYSDISELADMFIVACGIARFDLQEGFFHIADVFNWYASAEELQLSGLEEAVNKKMEINRQRKWNKGNGEYKHVEE